MRITEGMSYRNLLRDVAAAKERLENAQMQISSGRRVNKPSDDPAAAADIIRLTGEKDESAQYDRNLMFTRSKLDIADRTLDSIEKMVERARTLAQLSLGSPESGHLYRTEVEGLRDQILSAANTQHAGRFIFGGTVTTQPPFVEVVDGTVAYQGNAETSSLQVSRTLTIETQIPGGDLFTGAVDIFATMDSLVAAIQSGDKDAITAGIGNLEEFAEIASVGRSRIGSLGNLVSNFESEMTSARLGRETELNEVQAADLAAAISDFQMSENSLQATMAVGARITQLNLLDYL
jgi:flagellar hook-associated protein 3 FlgL